MNKENIKNHIVNIFYPRRCAVCDRALPGEACICSSCEEQTHVITGDTCFRCGKKLNSDESVYCFDCRKLPRNYERGFAIFEYEDIKHSLYRFKYSGRPEYARYYALKTFGCMGDTVYKLGIQAFIPVPVHEKRLRKRGYNQAEEFARELSKLYKIPTVSSYLVREKHTEPLKIMAGEQRRHTLKNAFKLARNDVKLSRVCVIDDIYTTGATINEISAILKANGVKEVYFITVAIGKGL